MQPHQLAMRGRSWGGAGRCILHLYLPVCAPPQVATQPLHLLHLKHTPEGGRGGGGGVEEGEEGYKFKPFFIKHSSDSGGGGGGGKGERTEWKEDEGKVIEEGAEGYKFESFILKFQQFITRPKPHHKHHRHHHHHHHHHHHPSAKGYKGRHYKGSSTHSSPHNKPYQSFTACYPKTISGNQPIESPLVGRSSDNNTTTTTTTTATATATATTTATATATNTSTMSSLSLLPPSLTTDRLTDTQTYTDMPPHRSAIAQTHIALGQTSTDTDIHRATDKLQTKEGKSKEVQGRDGNMSEVERREERVEGREVKVEGKERREEKSYERERRERRVERREMKVEGKEEREEKNYEVERRDKEMKGTEEKSAIKERGKGKERENNKVKERGKESAKVEEEEEEEEEEVVEDEGGRRGGAGKLGGGERSLVCFILDAMPKSAKVDQLEECLRQNTAPPFPLLLHLCAAASQNTLPAAVEALQRLTQRLHPQQYTQHLGLDYYWAGALCRAGEIERSLAVLLHLHTHIHPKHNSKVKNMTQLVLYRIVEEEDEEKVAQAVDFVDAVANDLGYLGPALSLWSATFTSPLFRMQQVSEWLIERHPKLVQRLGNRLEGLVERAEWAADRDLLQRTLHLCLTHKLSAHYPTATNALLQLQCDEGDLRGAEETIKFAQQMEIRVTPKALHRFLALLSRNRRPAPLALLALKYHPLSPRPAVPPPKPPKYKF